MSKCTLRDIICFYEDLDVFLGKMRQVHISNNLVKNLPYTFLYECIYAAFSLVFLQCVHNFSFIYTLDSTALLLRFTTMNTQSIFNHFNSHNLVRKMTRAKSFEPMQCSIKSWSVLQNNVTYRTLLNVLDVTLLKVYYDRI